MSESDSLIKALKKSEITKIEGCGATFMILFQRGGDFKGRVWVIGGSKSIICNLGYLLPWYF